MPDAEHQSRQPRNSQPERLRRLCGDGSAQRMNHPSLKLWRPGTWTAPNRRRFLEKKGTGKETGSKLLETFGNQRLFDNTSGGVRERVESVLTHRATATPTRPRHVACSVPCPLRVHEHRPALSCPRFRKCKKFCLRQKQGSRLCACQSLYPTETRTGRRKPRTQPSMSRRRHAVRVDQRETGFAVAKQ